MEYRRNRKRLPGLAALGLFSTPVAGKPQPVFSAESPWFEAK